MRQDSVEKSKISVRDLQRSESVSYSRISPRGIKMYQNVLNPTRSQSEVTKIIKEKAIHNTPKKKDLAVINDTSLENLQIFDKPKSNLFCLIYRCV